MPRIPPKTGSRKPRWLTLLAGLSLLVALVVRAGPVAGQVSVVTQEAARGAVSLVGQWQFQPGDDVTWSSPGFDDSAWSRLAVPGRWPEGGYPETGQLAWYRLTVKLDLQSATAREQLPQLGIRMGKVASAYELYAGGQLLGGVGKLPPLAEINYDRERIFSLPRTAISPEGTLVLALRVWGGDAALVSGWGAGPYAGNFSLGEFRGLLQSSLLGEVAALIISALSIGFGLYHLYLFRRNTQLKTYLWFGMLAVNIGIYGLLLTQWKYVLGWSFLGFEKVEFGAIYLFPALGIQMVWSLLEKQVGYWLRSYQLTFVAAALLVVVVPGHAVIPAIDGLWQIWTVPALLLVPATVLREARAGNPEARTLAVGLLVFIATCINDLLIDLAGVPTTQLVPYGFLAIMLAMAVSLANRFTSMFNDLEYRVQERTAALSAANRQLAQAARIDPLTGVFNRRGFGEEAEAEVQRSLRSGRGFALVLADVDKFKDFNDRYGHACGDHVLTRIATIFRANVRDVDRIARWGGEEFIVLLPETDVEGAAVLAEKLREGIASNLFEFEGQRLNLTMTFGIASHRKGETLDSCLARADTALYQGKEQGRNQVMIGTYSGLTLIN